SGNILTATFADYLLPTARDVPAIEIHHLETQSEAFSITKAKGLGEGGAIGAPAAILNAINDALAPFGASIDELPATPQRIAPALRAAGSATRIGSRNKVRENRPHPATLPLSPLAAIGFTHPPAAASMRVKLFRHGYQQSCPPRRGGFVPPKSASRARRG